MNFSELSDFEINKAVAENLNRSREDGSELEKMFAISLLDSAGSGRFDPCNNPGDAWPIIVESRIDIEFCEDDGNVTASFFCHAKRDFLGWHNCENPLRAAMIVYLMMQGESA